MIPQLVVKEVREHRWVGIGVFLLGVATFFAFVEMWLRHEPPSALVAPASFSWGAGPMIAAYTARRLFVIEHEQRTVQLLRSLPVSAAAVTATKLVLGLLYNLGVNLIILGATAWAIRNQEIISFDWVVRLSVQVSTYVFAWYAIACLHAHLGAYRFASWVVFLVALMTFEGVVEDPSRNLFWTAPLADDIELTRYATPWDAVGIGLAWGVGALVLTILVASARGGTRVDAWYAPMSGRRRAEVTGVTIAVLLLLDVVSQTARRPLFAGRRDGPAAITTHDPELRPLADALEGALERLGRDYGVRELPRVLLRTRRDGRIEPVLTSMLKSGDLIVGVRADAPAGERMRLIVTDILVGQSGGHWERVPAVGAWALGFAPFALEETTLSTTAARLADVSPALLDDFEALRQRFGRRGVEAAGWLAWRAAAEVGGPAAVETLATALFQGPRSRTGMGLIWARRVRPQAILRSAGVDPEALRAAWTAAAAEHRRAHPVPSWSVAPARLERPDARLARLVWDDLPVDVDQHRVELWWSVAPNLYPYPVPQDVLRAAEVGEPHGQREILLDPRRRIVTTWVVDGEVLGWSEALRP